MSARTGALVLAGGRSSRMGRDKASLPWPPHGPAGSTLLAHVVTIVGAVADEVIVVARADQILPALPSGTRVVIDTVAGEGPLRAIASGLAAATSDAVFVTGCDAPFLRPAVVAAMLAAFRPDRAVGVDADRPAPLPAVLPREAARRVAEALLATGERRVSELHARLGVVHLGTEILDSLDPDRSSLANVNDPEAWTAAHAHWARAVASGRIQPVIDQRIAREFNEHICFELGASHLYLSMAAWFESHGLPGFSNWMRRQAEEEHLHAIKFFDFLLTRGGTVRLGTIPAPASEWATPLAVFEAAQAHEVGVTQRINTLVDTAIAARDHAANAFLQWFVNEQVEEEAGVGDVVNRLRLVGNDGRGILLVDQELQQRQAVTALKA